MRPCLPKPLGFGGWDHPPPWVLQPLTQCPPTPCGCILHLRRVVGVQLPPGAPWAVGAGGWGGSDVLLEIQRPRPGEDPGVPLVRRFVRGNPSHATEGVAGLPPALRGLHLPGAVGRWTIPQELGQLSLL